VRYLVHSRKLHSDDPVYYCPWLAIGCGPKDGNWKIFFLAFTMI
jgi:hypothetical protein